MKQTTFSKLRKSFSQKQKKLFSTLLQYYRKAALFLEVSLLSSIAAVANLFDAKLSRAIPTVALGNIIPQQITLNCLGAIDLRSGRSCGNVLSSLSDRLQEADISLASVMPASDEAPSEQLLQLLRDHRIAVPTEKELFSARIFTSAVGNVALITYERHLSAAAAKQIKLEFARYIRQVKQKKADFIVIYVNDRTRKGSVSSKEARLFQLLSQLGADYIVGVSPNRRDGGTTYAKRDGSVARSVYSLGTFLSDSPDLSGNRVILRLKLRLHRGRLTLAEETYFPYLYTAESGMIPLLSVGPREKELRQHCGSIEQEMQRIRPANRLLTLGKMAELIGTELPQDLQFMKDFSLGKVCARSFEVKPGDVFFFREPFDDPNDLVPVSEKTRLNLAKTAVRRGAVLIVTYRPLPVACPQLICANAMEAHIAVCAYLRSQFDMRTVGITGSVGKTSTKDMLAEVTGMWFHTVKSDKNSNVQVKIGMNLQKLDSRCEVYIQEIGGGRPGGASRHGRMVLPEVTVVTNIGDAHIGNFGSKEKLMENKLGITEGMDESGILYLNGDDPLLQQAKTGCKTVLYAVHNRNADYYAEQIREDGFGTDFFIVSGDSRVPVRLNVLGEYNVLNAVGCYAIGRQFGIPEEKILEGLANFRTVGVRQNRVSVCGREFFMDCYNASSGSVKSAMEILCKLPLQPGKKRIAVIGDITGMGELTEEVHRDIAHTISRYPADEVILFGDFTKYTCQTLQQLGGSPRYITDRAELNRTLQELVDVGDVAMFKGSSKMLLEYSVDTVYGTRMTDTRFLEETEYRRLRIGGISYNLFADYATAVRYSPSRSGSRRVQIPEKIGTTPVVNIGRTFAGSGIAEAVLPRSVRHIGTEAFMNCSQLEELPFPRGLKFIGERAFLNCSKLRRIDLPEGVLHIGASAFAGCTQLQHAVIPASVVQIDEDAFSGCNNARFICPPGSFAERHLRSIGVPTQAE